MMRKGVCAWAPCRKHPDRLRFALALLSGLALPVLLLAGAPAVSDRARCHAMSARPPGVEALSAREAYPQGALPDDLLFDDLLLEKGKRRLTAFAGGQAVRVYLVALGGDPVGPKQVEGDMRTPEGSYVINDKNPNSAYYKNVGISYPNAADRERAKKLGKSPGGDIKIHGLAPHFAAIGAAHRLTDWTWGCIAVTNAEMEEIFTRTTVGTPIEILP
jgi:hypothetical protein